ncbi:brefeldin A-inhibited guanine nucleotide-exchange protein 2-like [Salvia divinorum]|uniref:Brefeldin A-inhibited guanine nucleotide-exchange protein 2-like n=1 Tax=Salvia divinorum TaxID=28513 RepID=A0ABD1IFT5_SALDI
MADSRLNRVLIPALEKIQKNASWRKHSKLGAECKTVIEHLTSPNRNPTADASLLQGVVLDLSLYDSEIVLSPLINALSTNYLKVTEPALDAVQKLIARGYLQGEADPSGGAEAKLLSKLIVSVCKCQNLEDEYAELLVIKSLLSAVASASLRLHGDCLLQAVRSCYDIYLNSKNGVNQTTAKASLVQMLVIVFRRMEGDSSTVPLQPIVVAELMGPVEKADVDGGFETKTSTVEGTNPADLLDSTDKDMLDAKYWEISMYKTALEVRKGELADGEGGEDDDLEVQIGNKLRRDAFLVFRALCKLSMKTQLKDAAADPQAMKGKIVALELLKILLENAGEIFRNNERFLDAIKQYLCLSLLKNSASTHMIVFQLSCSIFMSLVSRFRAPLKAEIGVFFPMIILRVLENVVQPNFQQKVTVLHFLEKLCVDSQILIEIFLNYDYDCDVNASNIFTRMVNGLLKTAQGVPPGVSSTLQSLQDASMKLEAMKCLVAILKCMGNWMNNQLRIADIQSSKKLDAADNGSNTGSPPRPNGNIDEPTEGSDAQSEASSEVSDVSTLKQCRAYRARKSESIYYPAINMVVLKFMIEACWAPMLAAFSVQLDQSDDEIVIALCLEGFRSAIHVTAGMSMKTHRDAFVTSLAKFTSLHSPADIKKKNIDAIKVIVTIADEDGNYLQNGWEHILTCVSRFEHLHLLGEEVAPPDASFFAIHLNELDKAKQGISNIIPVLKKKGAGKIQYAASAMRRGSYDSAGIGGNVAAGITSGQMNNLFSNLNMLEQVGDVNRIFIRSQKLNSEAIVDFVKALCKVSMDELRCTSNPRVFSLTKIVEIVHYNMNRIRPVWSKIWQVLSDFFVTTGCSENLSIAIFAMDSLCQLSMTVLEREELANYNFQNDFMKPFVIVMRKSSAVEIRELSIRCVSQVVLSQVNNVKSGWKSIFMVFTTAAYDDHKNIVLLSFEIIQKIVRDYFTYITETESTTFTDCVNCLIAFTNTRFNKEISLNALGLLRYCAEKLAEGDLRKEAPEVASPSSPQIDKERKSDNREPANRVDHLYLWFPLLAGLSERSFDPRPEIRKSAAQILFDTLRNYGHHFSVALWEKVFESVLFRIFDNARRSIDPSSDESAHIDNGDMEELNQDSWMYEMCTLAMQLVVDLFVNFYDTVNPLLTKVLMLLVSFIKRPHQSLAVIGITGFVGLMSNAGEMFSEDKWSNVVSFLKEALNETCPDFSFILDGNSITETQGDDVNESSRDESAGAVTSNDDSDNNLRSRHLYAAISDIKCRSAIQLLLIRAIVDIYNMQRARLSVRNIFILFDVVHAVAFHAHNLNSNGVLRQKLQELGPMMQMEDPLLGLETQSYQICLTFLQNLALDRPPSYEESEVESYLVNLCQEVLQFYIVAACSGHLPDSSLDRQPHWTIPLGSGRRELAARAPLIVATLQAIGTLGDSSFHKNLSCFFPLLSSLIGCEHFSNEVQLVLSDVLHSSVGPILLRSY